MKSLERKRRNNGLAWSLYILCGVGLVAIVVLTVLLLTRQRGVVRQINLVAWNVESGGNDSKTIAMQMRSFQAAMRLH